MAGSQDGPGTHLHSTFVGGNYPPVGAVGNTVTTVVGAQATVKAPRGGAMAFGSAYANNATAVALVQSTGYASFTAGYAAGGGASTLEATGPGSVAIGYPFARRVNSVSKLSSSGSGSFATGRVRSHIDGSLSYLTASGNGAFAAGYARSALFAVAASVISSGLGSFAAGYAKTQASGSNGSGATLLASGSGAFAAGYVNGNDTGNAHFINATGTGAFAQGTSAGTMTASGGGSFTQGSVGKGGQILSSALGAFAQGKTTTTGIISASKNGAFAQGLAAAGSTLSSSKAGAFAQGYAYLYNITASGYGAFAHGYADTGAIVASANNSAQFGIGTNSIADSLQVGTGFQTVGTSGNTRFDGSLTANQTTVTGTSHTAANEYVILCDDDTAGTAVTVTLPAVADGLVYHIKKLGSTANVIIDGNASETIDDGLTATLTTQYEAITIVSTATEWFII